MKYQKVLLIAFLVLCVATFSLLPFTGFEIARYGGGDNPPSCAEKGNEPGCGWNNKPKDMEEVVRYGGGDNPPSCAEKGNEPGCGWNNKPKDSGGTT